MRNYFIHLFLLFFFVFFLPLTQHVSAAEFFEGETITVPYNKVIEGSIFAGGRSILIQGEVKGDVYCAGKEVIVSGTIGGDLICGGQTIIVEGIVKGNTRVAAQIVDISGSVGHNVTSMGQTVTFQENASVAGEIVTAAQSLRMRGRTEKDLTGWVESSDIRGGVGGNIDLHSESLTIGNTASVGGNLTYVSSSVATIEQNAKILGQTNHTVPSSPPQKNVTNSTLMPHRWNGGAYIIFSLILGGILLFFFKEKIMTHIERIEMQWLQTFGWGIIACISIPILLLLLAITLIGIPFAIIGGMFFILLYFAGRVLTAIIVGKLVSQRLIKGNEQSPGWWLVIGICLTWIVFSIPVIGGIASFIASIFGIGATLIGLTAKIPRGEKSKKKTQ